MKNASSTEKAHYHPRLNKCLERYPALENCAPSIQEAFLTLKESFEDGGQLLLCGNGGSCSDSDHISGELLKGFQSRRPLSSDWKNKLGAELAENLQDALPAIPLTNFNGLITAFNNDCNPEYVFAQLTWGLGKALDVLLCISTSGNSKNLVHAAKVAAAKDMKVIALTGETGGALKPLADVCICAPSTITAEIQEYHLPIYHTLCLMLEADLFDQ